MNNFFQLSVEDQQRVLQQASARLGLPPQAIEKDLWVTTILQIVFALPFADKLIFKGGTSLSKVWHQIERFSEDIDLAVDRSLFDMEGDLTKKQIKRLRKESSLFIKEQFCPALQSKVDEYGLSALCTIEAEPDGEGDNTYPEPRKVFVKYGSAWAEPMDYLSPVVMLEIGARSLFEPNEKTNIHSMVEDLFPSIRTTLVDSLVITALASKTFLEKAFLLHELFSVKGRGATVERKSRHLYDLSRMMKENFALAAIHDDELWESIRHHREIFTSVRGMDYTPDVRKHISLIPPDDIRAVWEQDYKNMCSSMIFGDKPTFDELLEQMKVLEARFHEA
jgi:hypothetical protein